jgi:hypothetical protein
MPKKEEGLSLEEPVMDLHVEKPKSLPKLIPDIFGLGRTRIVDEVLNHTTETRVHGLANDVDVFLKIGDVESAKNSYKQLLDNFNRLPVEKKKEYFAQVQGLYNKIKNFKAFWKEYKKTLAK